MKTKKSPNADLESKRSLFFALGLVLSLGMVLAAFSFKSPVDAIPDIGRVDWDTPEEVFIPRTKPEESKPISPVLTINEIVLNLDEGAEELDFSGYTDEINLGEAIALNPLLSERSPEAEEVPLVDFAEYMPEFPGGMPSLLRFVSRSIKYPEIAKQNGVQGKIFVRFVVNTDGSISDAFVLRPLDPSLDKEAIRVVTSMPRWKPGSQNGKPVRVNFTIPINFVLQ
ncbi:energy transducer TonB [Mangrovibacterium sp.]|uniref:energy transducer TonB n=1 Tax=Mangrovibacterium sp. TaxID=1961364 RepID=UPI0035678F21